MQKNSGIKFLKIYSESIEGQIYYLWELSDDAWEDGGEWWDGQVSFNTNRVRSSILSTFILICLL